MKLWIQVALYTVFLLILSGCVAKVTPKKEAVIDDTLPVIQLTKNGTMVDMNAIALEWASLEDPRVKGVYIYKVALDEKDIPENEYYDTVDNRFSTHYLDTEIVPDSKYNYYFKTFSANAESRKSKTTLIQSLPLMESTTWIHSIQGMPRSAKIIWRPHTNEKVKEYIIQRRTLQDEYWDNVSTVRGRLNAEYIDKKLKDNFTYIYRIRAVTYDHLTSKPSQEVKVITKALPQELTKIEATINLSRKIEIKWETSKTKDFLKYKLYRASKPDGKYKLISDLTKNFYVDIIEEDAKQYFYRVSVVDKDGLESIHDNYSVQGKTLLKPNAPSLVDAKLIDGKVKISWSNSDSRVKSYIVQKKYKKNLFESSIEDFENIKGVEFIDSEIETDKVYHYKVFAVDKYDIKSEPSIEVELKTDKELPKNNFKRKVQDNNFVEEVKDEKIESNNFKEDVISPTQDFN
ncbi:MAG: hypothetical protein L3J19_06315 [Sulfurimonas sp.]|nr:hypothetical protein [Sulfurimonas sp.]